MEERMEEVHGVVGRTKRKQGHPLSVEEQVEEERRKVVKKKKKEQRAQLSSFKVSTTGTFRWKGSGDLGGGWFTLGRAQHHNRFFYT